MLRAVIFDMDDTLIDWSTRTIDWETLRRIHITPVYEHLTEKGHKLPKIDRVSQIYHNRSIDAWASIEPPDYIAPRQLHVLRDTLASFKIEFDDDELDALQRIFAWELIPGISLFHDTLEVLDTLRDQGIKIGLLTNAINPMWMRDRELDALGLLDYFDCRMTAGDIGRMKPHPDAFKAVLNALDTRPEDAVFVGDRPQDDVIGAQSVGMKAAWVRRRSFHLNGIKPDVTINHLNEILPQLDRWYPGWRET